MKLFLRVIGFLLIAMGIITIGYISITNWKDSELIIYMNHWKIVIPSIISVFVGYFMLYISEKH